MAYSPATIRTIGRACLIAFDEEGNTLTIQEIVNAKPMTQENKDLVLAWIYTQRPELDPSNVPPAEEPSETDPAPEEPAPEPETEA